MCAFDHDKVEGVEAPGKREEVTIFTGCSQDGGRIVSTDRKFRVVRQRDGEDGSANRVVMDLAGLPGGQS